MPRSGTTLAHQIIASHNKVVGAGEIFYLEQVIKKLFFEDGRIILKKIKDSFESKENILNNEYFKLLNFHGYDKSIIIEIKIIFKIVPNPGFCFKGYQKIRTTNSRRFK